MKTLLLFLALTLAACQYAPPRDVDSAFYPLPVGSQLRLTRPLTIPANDAGVFIQDGQAQYSYWRLNKYYPNCDFELHTRASHKRVIEPDTFTITRTVREVENVLLAPAIIAARDFGNGAPQENYMTVLYLHSGKQPEVFRLTCQHWEDPNDGQHLSVTQIRQVLGDLIILELAGEKS